MSTLGKAIKLLPTWLSWLLETWEHDASLDLHKAARTLSLRLKDKDGTVVGKANLTWMPMAGQLWWAYGLWIDQKWRKGKAIQVIREWQEKVLSGMEAYRVSCLVRADNAAGRKAAEKVGYKATDEHRSFLGNQVMEYRRKL